VRLLTAYVLSLGPHDGSVPTAAPTPATDAALEGANAHP